MRAFEDTLEPSALDEERHDGVRRLRELSLAALGVVYGDLGTSPLYAVRECFYGSHAVQPDRASVLGVLSLIVWSLILVISVKYLVYVLRADNRGEGGILALMALIQPTRTDRGKARHRRRWLLVSLGLLGATLLYGDGAITPAISVLSAVEGLEIESPAFSPYVLPLTVGILVLLFLFQRRGTGSIGGVFGPIMLLWFAVLALLGMRGIVQRPEVFEALSPIHAVRFFAEHRWRGFLVLGAVVLVVTGSEALYADMGHFGKKAIRTAWFVLVFPALLLNYFGQGALLLERPELVESPFYHLAPHWAHYPLVILATIATIIASQAIISGAFSLTRQAVQLGYCPRLRIIHTSAREIGQVYLPSVNWALMALTLILVVSFRRSTHLAAAYGVAVTATMLITTLLAYVVAREFWGWSRLVALAVTTAFLIPDLAFFGANVIKVEHGGWVPIVLAFAFFAFMSTWWKGRRLTDEALGERELPLESFLSRMRSDPPLRVPGTAVFLSGHVHGTPLSLSRHLALIEALHEQVVLLTVVTRSIPFVPADRRVDVRDLGQGFYRVFGYYGFMQSPRIRPLLHRCRALGLSVDPVRASFFSGRVIIFPSRDGGMPLWRARLYSLMARNALRTPESFHIPHERLIEIGVAVEV